MTNQVLTLSLALDEAFCVLMGHVEERVMDEYEKVIHIECVNCGKKRAEMKIGTRIKEIRKSKGFTQLSLGKELKADQATISRIENGETQPSLKFIMDLSKLTKLDYNEILGGLNE
jgi:DNA-binding XRE family transcriptional regulator